MLISTVDDWIKPKKFNVVRTVSYTEQNHCSYVIYVFSSNNCLAHASSYKCILVKRDLDQGKISVESSFILDLPPNLIVPSTSIKLNETIGQGVQYTPML